MDYTSKEVTALLGLVVTYRRWKNFDSFGDRRYKHYHPSEWGKCLRSQQYKHYVELGFLKTEPTVFESKLLRLFDKGHNMHNRWTNYFDDMGGILRGRWRCGNSSCYMFEDDGTLKSKLTPKQISKILEEKKRRVHGSSAAQGIFRPDKCACGCSEFNYLETHVENKELNMKGNSDLLLDCSYLDSEKFKEVRSTFNIKYLPKTPIVGDLKTIGSSSWEYQLNKRGPHKYYLIQLTIYMYILDCEYALLMYENKDNSQVKWYKVERNDKWWEIIKWQSKKMQSMVANKQLPPPRPLYKSSYDCKSCDFKGICHKSKIWKNPKLEDKREGFYQELL